MSVLERFGPGARAESVTNEQALEYVRGLARSHDENFSVITSLVPPHLRDDFAAVYAFCRWADDLGDETGRTCAARERSLQLLDWWADQTRECFAGRAAHPVFVALAATIQKHNLPMQPFLDLIDAFEQDQRISEYENWPQLIDYCRRSANPVGRIVLYLGGYPDNDANAERYACSDATCTALQLVNFWQDVRRDLDERERVYIPLAESGLSLPLLRNWAGRPDDHIVRVTYILALRPLVERTRELFQRGAALPSLLDPAIRPVVWLFGAGGTAILKRVESIGCATLWERPRLSKLTKASLVGRAWLGARMGNRQTVRPAPAPRESPA